MAQRNPGDPTGGSGRTEFSRWWGMGEVVACRSALRGRQVRGGVCRSALRGRQVRGGGARKSVNGSRKSVAWSRSSGFDRRPRRADLRWSLVKLVPVDGLTSRPVEAAGIIAPPRFADSPKAFFRARIHADHPPRVRAGIGPGRTGSLGCCRWVRGCGQCGGRYPR